MPVECFRRDGEGNWVQQTYNQGEEIYFASGDFSCRIEALYRLVSLLNT